MHMKPRHNDAGDVVIGTTLYVTVVTFHLHFFHVQSAIFLSHWASVVAKCISKLH